jgi:hypothetical protein
MLWISLSVTGRAIAGASDAGQDRVVVGCRHAFILFEGLSDAAEGAGEGRSLTEKRAARWSIHRGGPFDPGLVIEFWR